MDIKEKFSIIILSCDKYSDLWKPFFNLFFRFWPDCPFPIMLVSNSKRFLRSGIKQLLVGPDKSWSDTLLTALSNISTEYVLLMLEDIFLTSAVDTEVVINNILWLDSRKGNYLRLNPTPKPVRKIDEEHGEAPPSSVYRTSTVFCIWRKSVLEQLLVPGESAWDFEIFGSVRSDIIPGFYACIRPTFQYINGVVKGKWSSWAVTLLKQRGVNLDLHARPIMGWCETVGLRLAIMRGLIYELIPWKWRRLIKGWTRPMADK